MSPTEFWDGDNLLPRAYREAEKLRRNRTNEELWLQGMYIYEALCDVAPILRAFGKKGTKAHPYPSEPYAISREEIEERDEAKERRDFDNGLAKMKAIMEQVNERMKQRAENKEVVTCAEDRRSGDRSEVECGTGIRRISKTNEVSGEITECVEQCDRN